MLLMFVFYTQDLIKPWAKRVQEHEIRWHCAHNLDEALPIHPSGEISLRYFTQHVQSEVVP